MAEKNYVVNVINTDDTEVTGTFGPMTEKEADEFCNRFVAKQEEIGKTEGYIFSITELSDPFEFFGDSTWHRVHEETK